MGLSGYKLSAQAAAVEQRRAVALSTKSVEGQYREGPYLTDGGWLPSETPWNFFQTGLKPAQSGHSAMVEACVSAYSQTVAMCPGNQWRWTKDEGRERVTGSALVRILKRPNAYQSISDFLLNAVRQIYMEGNAYALILRNDRFEPAELHLMNSRHCVPQIGEDGEVYYHLGGNPIIEQRLGGNIAVPARDVIHMRLHTPRHPLIGESPLAAAALELAVGNAALQQQITFFLNQARPSFLLTTDNRLDKQQTLELRESWNEQSRGMKTGGTPILSAGLKAQMIASSAKDAELAELLRLSDLAIARAFRIPIQVVGVEGGTPYASTEALMQHWKAQGLGFALNHIEEAIGNAFKLGGQPDEYLEFDTSALLRSNFKERVEAWAAGVTGGVFARNEARHDFELAPVEGGDEPWVQQQDIPLSDAAEMASELTPPEPSNDDEEEQQRMAMTALFEKDLKEALRA